MPPAAPRPSARRDPWLAACLVLCWLAALLPIWRPRFLPLLDLPNHLARIAVWHRLGDPSWHYQDFYAYHRAPGPPWGYYFPTHLLCYLFPIETANRLFLSAYAAALPAAVLAFARRFDRSPWLALLVFPLIFSYSFACGFIPSCAGVPVMLLGLCALDRSLERPSAPRLAAVFLLGLLCLLLDPLPWLLLLACGVPVLLAGTGPFRRRLPAAAALLLTVGALALEVRFAPPGGRLAVSGGWGLDGRFLPLIDAAAALPRRLVMSWTGSSDDRVLLALALSWWLLATTSLPQPGPGPGTGTPRRRTLRDWVPEMCFGLLLLGYLLLPARTYRPLDYWNISPQLLAPAALFGALCVRGPIGGWRRLLLVPALGAALCYPGLLCGRFLAFSSRAAGFAHLLTRVPRGSSTLVLMLGGNDDAAVDPEQVPYLEFPAYAQVLGGGFNPFLQGPGFPFRFIPGRQLPGPFWARPWEFDQARMGARYDFVLTRNENADGQVMGGLRGRVPLVGKEGPWRLYQSRGIK